MVNKELYDRITEISNILGIPRNNVRARFTYDYRWSKDEKAMKKLNKFYGDGKKVVSETYEAYQKFLIENREERELIKKVSQVLFTDRHNVWRKIKHASNGKNYYSYFTDDDCALLRNKLPKNEYEQLKELIRKYKKEVKNERK